MHERILGALCLSLQIDATSYRYFNLRRGHTGAAIQSVPMQVAHVMSQGHMAVPPWFSLRQFFGPVGHGHRPLNPGAADDIGA